MNKIQWKSLKFKLALVVSTAFIFASIVFIVFSQSISWNMVYGNLYFDQWKSMCEETIEAYQEFVTDNELTTEQALNLREWEHKYNNVSIGITESESTTYWEKAGFITETGIPVKCVDGVVYVYVSPSFKYSNGPGIMIGFIAAAIVFFIVIIPYIYGLIRRISKLTEENDLAKTHLLEQMEAKNEAIMANSKLITSLSHDFRTPLTRLTGYLEIIKYRKFKDETDYNKFLDSALRNAGQMKELSDEMFAFFKVNTTKEISCPVTDKTISELIAGFVNDLKMENIQVKSSDSNETFVSTLKEYYIHRIFNNLFSNVKKYADPVAPVEIDVFTDAENAVIRMRNHIRSNPGGESNGIGLKTVKIILEQNGGNFHYEIKDDVFESVVVLPLE